MQTNRAVWRTWLTWTDAVSAAEKLAWTWSCSTPVRTMKPVVELLLDDDAPEPDDAFETAREALRELDRLEQALAEKPALTERLAEHGHVIAIVHLPEG